MARPIGPDTVGVTSPLGTGITIAIAILLAVGVAIMVRVFADQDEPTPHVAFAKDETTDSFRVIQAQPGLMRSAYEVRMSVAGDIEFGGPVGPGGDALPANAFVALGGAEGGPPDAPLVTGNVLHFCAEPGTSVVIVEFRHVNSNTIVLREEFLTLEDCPT